MKEIITSASNNIVKETKKLKQKKYREERGLYIIEGVKMVEEAVNLGKDIEYIFVDGNSGINFANFEQKGYNVYILGNHIFGSVSDTVTPQGVLAVAKTDNYPLAMPRGNCLVLDGISDAGNLGTIIRTAAAAGYEDIYLIDCADAYNPKVVRSSMGGLFHVRIFRCGYEVLPLISKNVTLIGADMGGIEYTDYSVSGKAGIIIGSEAHGLSGQSRQACRELVSVPMRNVESLNAAVTAGILMYRYRQEQGDVTWQDTVNGLI